MTTTAQLRHAPSPVRRARGFRRPTRGVLARVVLRAAVPLGAVAVAAFWYSGARPQTTPAVLFANGGELCGLLGSYLVCVLLVLVSRAPWVERVFGLDHLVGWHRSLGTTVVLLVGTHVVLASVGGVFRDSNPLWAEVPHMLVTVPDLEAGWVGTGLFLLGGLASSRVLRRVLRYETWWTLHLALYVGIYLGFWHQLTAGFHFVSNPAARLAWILLYSAAGATVVTWRVIRPLWRLRRHVFQIEKVVAETPRTTSVWLVGDHVEELGVRAGQFFLVKFLTFGHLVTAHPYSVSGTIDGRIRFTIGHLGNHSSAVGRLRVGTHVLLEGPFGRFTAERSRAEKLLLVAGGAGVGPIRALAEELDRAGRDVVVLHRASTPEELALGGELGIALEHRYIPLVGRRKELGYDPLGHRNVARQVPDVAEREVFFCGSPGMADTLLRTCRKLRIPPQAVHFEELSFS
ncbi:MAG: ferredoxin reductase family protein [Promicromonosporaceae bacterium]|nr:ferredoxin reductase family protein [Promicromonosporaceae bacterium]